ncbi:hypothetical protein EXE43_02670 [Halorubrum sp. SS5]|nr:hypothetical protein EXE43_02670 [Halorubrum sp. SS5]
MGHHREPQTERDELAAAVEGVVESDTDTLVDAVSRGEIAAPELKALCREADADTAEIDDGVLEVVRIIAPLLDRHGERAGDATP